MVHLVSVYDEAPQKHFHAISPYEGNDTFCILTEHLRVSEDAHNADFSAFKDPPAGFFKIIKSWALSPQALILPAINASPAFFKHFNITLFLFYMILSGCSSHELTIYIKKNKKFFFPCYLIIFSQTSAEGAELKTHVESRNS